MSTTVVNFGMDVYFGTLIAYIFGQKSFQSLIHQFFPLINFTLGNLMLSILEYLFLVETGLDHLLDDELTSFGG